MTDERTIPKGRVTDFQGTCFICNATVAKGQMTSHLSKCLSKMESRATGPTIKLFHIIAEGLYLPQYWIHRNPAKERTILKKSDTPAMKGFCDGCQESGDRNV
jgi:hypothetical protein